MDGLTTTSAGRLARSVEGLLPCTPQGVISLLEDEGVELQGANAVVVGRSDLVGKPLAQLLLQRNATVTIAHSKTKDLAAVTRQAEVVIAAAGVPHLIGAEHISAGAVVIDVGIPSAEGLIGDVDFDAVSKIASKITPVPGGVGPMTIAELLRNTLQSSTAPKLITQFAGPLRLGRPPPRAPHGGTPLPRNPHVPNQCRHRRRQRQNLPFPPQGSRYLRPAYDRRWIRPCILWLRHPHLMKDWGTDPVTLGVVGSIALAGMFAGGLVVAPLADKYGRRKLIVAGLILASIAAFACAFADTPLVLGALRFVVGVALGALVPNFMALTGELSPPSPRRSS